MFLNFFYWELSSFVILPLLSMVYRCSFYKIWPLMHAHQICSALSCPVLCDPTHWNPPGSSVHGIIPAGILHWVAISPSRGSSQLRDQIHISCASCIARQILYQWATGEAPFHLIPCFKIKMQNLKIKFYNLEFEENC